MNIEDLENSLNDYETNPERTLAVVLNTVVKNQAMLEVVLDSYLNIMSIIKPEINPNDLSKEIASRTESNLYRIQAEISSKLLD